MSISGMLLRFTGIYIAVLIVAGLLLTALGLKSSSGANTAALIGAVLGSCAWFANKNDRFLEPQERKAAIWGMCSINIVLQMLIAMTVGAAARAPFTPMIVAIAFVGLVQSALIYFMVGAAAKQHAKQHATQVSSAARTTSRVAQGRQNNRR
jgi:hypothetical protein